MIITQRLKTTTEKYLLCDKDSGANVHQEIISIPRVLRQCWLCCLVCTEYCCPSRFVSAIDSKIFQRDGYLKNERNEVTKMVVNIFGTYN